MPHNVLPTLQPHTCISPASSTSQRVSKVILKTALQKANAAVIMDKANDLTGAIDAYSDAVNLLDQVLSSETREPDRQSLKATYGKYRKRIQYLSTLKYNSDHLYETLNNKTVVGSNRARATNSLIITPRKQQQQGDRHPSSSLNSGKTISMESYQVNGSTMSTTLMTPTSPSSATSIPIDVPPSPVSSKSTPSRPTSNLKCNGTSDVPTALDLSSSLTPPLEPRSVLHPGPWKNAQIEASVTLQNGSSDGQDCQLYASSQRRSSINSLSSSSSRDSGSICASGPYQPTMALPSLLLTKIEAATPISTITDTTEAEPDINYTPSDRNSRGATLTMKSNPFSWQYPSTSTQPGHEATACQIGNEDLRQPLTTGLARKLRLDGSLVGSSPQRQRMASNTSFLDASESYTPPLSSAVLIGYHATQSCTTVCNSAVIEPDIYSARASVVQRQSSGLSIRKKYNRLSRASMDGAAMNGNNSIGIGNGGRKEKASPILGAFFGVVGDSDGTVSSTYDRATQDALNYFGNHSQQSYSDGSVTLESRNGRFLSNHHGATNPHAYPQETGRTTLSTPRYLDTYLKLIINLEHSMNYGGYVTPKLFIPRNLWYQSSIRLSSMDVKIAACESLILDLNRVEKWGNLDDIRGSLRLIESLEEVVDALQVTLSKKLKRDSLVDTSDDTNNGPFPSDVGGGTSQQHSHSNGGNVDGGIGSSSGSSGNSFNLNSNGSLSSNGAANKRAQLMSWGSKLTKSVERMNAFSLTKVDDQYRHYVEVLQKLFIKLHVLEMWFQHYLKKDRLINPHYDNVLVKLGRVCDGINRVVGGFVIRDLALLLGKWLKRGGVWVNE